MSAVIDVQMSAIKVVRSDEAVNTVKDVTHRKE